MLILRRQERPGTPPQIELKHISALVMMALTARKAAMALRTPTARTLVWSMNRTIWCATSGEPAPTVFMMNGVRPWCRPKPFISENVAARSGTRPISV